MLLHYFTIIILFGLSQNIHAAEIANIAIPDKKIALILSTVDQSIKTLPLNKMVPLIVDVQKTPETSPELKIKLIGFDAQMPEHGHGMVVTPKITSLNDAQWRIDGVKLHMPGAWELSVLIEVDGKDQRFTVKITL